MEECGQENEHNWKIVEEREFEKEQAGEIMQEHEVEKIQDGNLIKEHESKKQENERDGTMMEEHGNKERQDEKIVDSLDSDEKQDETIMEVFETEKLQNASKVEKCGQENEQDGKTVEIHEHGKCLAKHESENEQDCKMTEDCGSDKILDGGFIEEHEGEKQDWKVVEVFETEKIQYVKIMVTCEPENEQEGNNVEKCVNEHESGENQDGRRLEEQDKIMDVFESEKELDCKIGERHEDGKSLKQEGEKDQSWKMTETCESETIQYENIKTDSENHDKEGMSHMDVDKAVNVTVLKKEESYTEIMKRDKAIAESDEELKSDKENEKEQMDISLIQTEMADTAFSQHAPLFPESHATEPSQISDAFVPESISITQDKTEAKMSSTDTSPKRNLPTIQVESDLSRSSNQRDSDIKEKTESIDFQASPENSQDATLAKQTPDKQTCAEMLQKDKIVESIDLVEGIDAERKTSPIAENQAGIGQLNEREGLTPVSYFSEDSDSAVDLKHITHQLDQTDNISDVEEGEEAISLLANDTDMEQNLKCDSEPDQANKDIKYASLQKCETIAETPSGMRNDKIADEK
ncbi:uncharacterized protein [Garra rufa]|uniref:uncharacterized protein n=1 Tax=Garra rufa TaxID=137080 RepID=UPI003CCEF07D